MRDRSCRHAERHGRRPPPFRQGQGRDAELSLFAFHEDGPLFGPSFFCSPRGESSCPIRSWPRKKFCAGPHYPMKRILFLLPALALVSAAFAAEPATKAPEISKLDPAMAVNQVAAENLTWHDVT